jgi:hypothetical protein
MEPAYCKCGHGMSRHEIEPPYPCYECDCQGFTYPTDTARLARARKVAMELGSWFDRKDLSLDEREMKVGELVNEFADREVKAAIKWTPVSERLPERKKGFDHTGQCLVWYQGNEFNISKFGIAYYHYNSPYQGKQWIDFENLGRTPIAWMPLPRTLPTQGEPRCLNKTQENEPLMS